MTKVIRHIWKETHLLWKLRCSELQVHQPENLHRKEIEVNQEIELLYKLKTKVLPHDVNKFRATPADHLKESFYEKQNYLILHAKQLKQSAKQAAKKAKENLQNIFNFFTPRNQRQITTIKQSETINNNSTEPPDSGSNNT